MIRTRPYDVVVFDGKQIGETKWLVAIGNDERGGAVIAEADDQEEATQFATTFAGLARSAVQAFNQELAKRRG